MTYWKIIRITDEDILQKRDAKIRQDFDRRKGIVEEILAKHPNGLSTEDLLKEAPEQDREAVENMLPLLATIGVIKQ